MAMFMQRFDVVAPPWPSPVVAFLSESVVFFRRCAGFNFRSSASTLLAWQDGFGGQGNSRSPRHFSTGYPALASKKQQRFETCVSPLRQSTLERNANCTTVETPHACPVRWVFRPTLVECVSYSLGRRGQEIWELVLNWWIICYSVN